MDPACPQASAHLKRLDCILQPLKLDKGVPQGPDARGEDSSICDKAARGRCEWGEWEEGGRREAAGCCAAAGKGIAHRRCQVPPSPPVSGPKRESTAVRLLAVAVGAMLPADGGRRRQRRSALGSTRSPRAWLQPTEPDAGARLKLVAIPVNHAIQAAAPGGAEDRVR